MSAADSGLAELETRVEETIAWCRRLDLKTLEVEARVDQLDEQGGGHDAAGTNPPSHPEWKYSSVYDWMAEWFAVTFRKFTTGASTPWCAQWRDHPEALFRLTALWRSWEEHRDDQRGGMVAWLRDLDSQLAVLFAPDGPFRACRPRHVLPPSLPLGGEADG